MRFEAFFCDDCGEQTPARLLQSFARLPMAVSSANAGESAVLCRECASKMADKQVSG